MKQILLKFVFNLNQTKGNPINAILNDSPTYLGNSLWKSLIYANPDWAAMYIQWCLVP